jgi:hypothetical protein
VPEYVTASLWRTAVAMEAMWLDLSLKGAVMRPGCLRGQIIGYGLADLLDARLSEWGVSYAGITACQPGGCFLLTADN